jgi:hypothetical protein
MHDCCKLQTNFQFFVWQCYLVVHTLLHALYSRVKWLFRRSMRLRAQLALSTAFVGACNLTTCPVLLRCCCNAHTHRGTPLFDSYFEVSMLSTAFIISVQVRRNTNSKGFLFINSTSFVDNSMTSDCCCVLTLLMPSIALLCTCLLLRLQTGWFFGTRFFLRRRVFMHFIALLASVLLAMYTLYKLIYYFTGIEGYTCEQFKIVTGIAQG